MEIVSGTPLLSESGFISRFGEKEWADLTDGTGDGMPDDDFVARAIEDCEQIIARFLGQRYTLPLSVMPLDLARQSHDVLRYLLYRDEPTEEVKARYEAAIEWLRQIEGGAESLVSPDGHHISERSASARHGGVVRQVIYDDSFRRRYDRMVP